MEKLESWRDPREWIKDLEKIEKILISKRKKISNVVLLKKFDKIMKSLTLSKRRWEKVEKRMRKEGWYD